MGEDVDETDDRPRATAPPTTGESNHRGRSTSHRVVVPGERTDTGATRRDRTLSDRRVITLAMTALDDPGRRGRFRDRIGIDRLKLAIRGADDTGESGLALRGRLAAATLVADHFHRGRGTDLCGPLEPADSDE